MKSKIILTVVTLSIFVFLSKSYSQQLSDVSPQLLISTMKKTYLKVKRDYTPDIYVDLVKNKYTKERDPDNEYSKKEVNKVNFDYTVYEGSFINSGNKEYLLQINLSKGSYVTFFSHAENYGNTTMTVIFDQDYNQISEVSFQENEDRIIDIADIDEDGVLEIIFKGRYDQMGHHFEWIKIFSSNLDNLLLNQNITSTGEDSGIESDKIALYADYTIQNGGILFRSTLKYYRCKVINKKTQKTQINYYKTEYKEDFYKFENNVFTHIKGKNNVNWDDPKLKY